jgi:hypothetical protein
MDKGQYLVHNVTKILFFKKYRYISSLDDEVFVTFTKNTVP